MKLFSRNKPAEEKPELIDYLESLPEVDVPFQPFPEDEPVVVPQKTEAQALAEELRQRSKDAQLTAEKALRAAHENWEELLSGLQGEADIVFIKGEKDRYFYSNRYMTDNYARIAMLVEEKNWPHTIAEMVRFNCKTYPASTAYTYFMEHPYYLTRPQLERALAQVFRDPQYADIAMVNAANGEPYLYSRLFFTDRYGKALADYQADETM